MFEIELNELYEDNFHFRAIERAKLEAKERYDFNKQYNKKGKLLKKSRSVSPSPFKDSFVSQTQRPAMTRNLDSIQGGL